jgi:hypothetical protein
MAGCGSCRILPMAPYFNSLCAPVIPGPSPLDSLARVPVHLELVSGHLPAWREWAIGISSVPAMRTRSASEEAPIFFMMLLR